MISFDGMTTRRGDDGTSQIMGGPRMKKSDPVFAALGDVDELTSTIGVAKALLRRDYPHQGAVAEVLNTIQRDLIRIGASIATPEKRVLRATGDVITAADIERLETIEKTYITELATRGEFVIPGAHIAGAQVDVSRAVCRRAERQLVSYIAEGTEGHLEQCLRYLNRLSDLLYVIARRLES